MTTMQPTTLFTSAPRPHAVDLLARVEAFMRDHVFPNDALYERQVEEEETRVPPIFYELQARAKAEGLWNLFLPESELGAGLTNLEYAPMAEAMGWLEWSAGIFNCSAPDTGNMEVLVRYGTEAQKAKYLRPQLEGRTRSCFAMTEPDVASSDATNMQATAIVDGDEIVLNGKKWWSTGIGHPNCKVAIFMGLSDSNAHRHQ